MAVKHKRVIHKKHHPVITKIRKSLDKIEDEIADKVVHELKESKKTEKREHKTGKHKTAKKR